MADNTLLNAGTGGDTIASDDITGVKWPRVKLTLGADGVNDGDVATGNPLPVSDAGGSLTVDGTVTAAQATAASLNATVVGTGTFATQVTGDALTALQLIDDVVRSEDEASGDTHKGAVVLAVRQDTPAASSGTDGDYEPLKVVGGRLATQATQSGTWTVQPGNTANTTAWLVQPVPGTGNACTIFRSLDLDETEEEVKATAGAVHGAWVTNTATATRWLKFYNATAANVTVGTTTPVITIGIPGNTSDDISAVLGNGGLGIGFDTAITVAATTGVADADTGAPGANDVIVNIFYK